MIVLDPGHGGADSGARIGSADGHLCEKDWVLDCCLEAKRLARPGSISLTREDDRFLELTDRAAIANERKAEFFLSVHLNWFRKNQPRGFEIFTISSKGDTWARRLKGPILDVLPTDWPDRGLKRAGFSVLKNTAMAAALVEFGFITNAIDLAWLRRPDSPKICAGAIVDALGLRVSSSSPSPTPILRPDVKGTLEEMNETLEALLVTL